jgi:hypothetical protein
MNRLVDPDELVTNDRCPAYRARMAASARSSRRLGASATLCAVVLGLSACSSSTDKAGTDQSAIDQRAAEVMPFDLTLTTHTFTKTADGGTQTVTANDPADAEQITLVQDHLASEAEAFTRGDYTDPARIHGMDMPGLHELEAGAARVKVTYTALADGAMITYQSSEPALVEAIHQWFDRQSADHG